jgi:hypothetical protein
LPFLFTLDFISQDMKVTIIFNKEDYLQYLLYTASKSKLIKRTRLKTRLFLSASCFIASITFYFVDIEYLAIYFLVATIGCLLFVPAYQNKRYKAHCKKFIDEKYSTNIDTPCDIEINASYIYTIDKTGETKLNASEIIEINEIGNYFMLKFSSNAALTLPKRFFNYNELLKELTVIATTNNINYRKIL